MKNRAFPTALLILTKIIFAESRKLLPLVCNSVNDLSAVNVQSDFVYVTTQGKECTFIFQGPTATQLDLKVHSFSTEGQAKTVCKKPPVEVFSYSKRSKLRQLDRVLCAEDDIVRMVTETNTAVITSTLGYGSFFVKVRPVLAPVTPRLVTQTKRYSQLNAQRRSDQYTRRRNGLIRLNADYQDLEAIDGMFPPDVQSVDFFSAMNQFEIPLKFRAQPQGFTPSQYYPGPGNPRPTDSYGAPVTSGPILWGPYSGRPGPEISITSTSTMNPSSEWVISTRYPFSETSKATEQTTLSTQPNRETESLTSQQPTTEAMLEPTAATTSRSPEGSTENVPSSTPPSPQSEKVVETVPNYGTVATDETAVSNTQTFLTNTTLPETEKQDAKGSASSDQQITFNSVRFKPITL